MTLADFTDTGSPPMPRYFFHTADGSRARDTEGTVLDDQSSARAEAIRFLGDCMREAPNVLGQGRDFRVEVTDGTDMLLFTIIALAIDAPASGRPDAGTDQA